MTYDHLWDEPPESAAQPPAGKAGSSGADKASQSTQIVRLAESRFELGCSVEGEPFAAPRQRPKLVLPLRGGAHSVRGELAAIFAEEHDRAPSAQALADALLVLTGRAARLARTPLHLRVAGDPDTGLWLDLGDRTGRAAHVTADRWEVTEPPGELLFRRSDLGSPLPEPDPAGDLKILRTHLYLPADERADDRFALLAAWLVAALVPGIVHPILLVRGEHGAAKTTTARRLLSLVDPTPGDVRSPPRDIEGWAVAAAGSWVIALDNVSSIPEWLSDALCRAATGEAFIRRRLYTDSELAVLAYRRAIILTAIDPGSLSGDLADRLLPVELARVPDDACRPDDEIDARWRADHPAILGGLLTMSSRVLSVLPEVHLARHPRMAAFARIVAAVDRVLGTDALALYLGQSRRLAEDVVEDDPIATAVRDLVDRHGEWQGTAGQLLELLIPEQHRPKGWPDTPRGLSSRLTRAKTVLRAVGVDADYRRLSGGLSGGQRTRQWTLTRLAERRGEQPSPSSPSSPQAADLRGQAEDGAADADAEPSPNHQPSPQSSPPGTPSDLWKQIAGDGRPDGDGSIHLLSANGHCPAHAQWPGSPWRCASPGCPGSVPITEGETA